MGDLHLVLPALNLSTMNAGHEILVTAQGPLVLGFWVWGLGVWGLGLTKVSFTKLLLPIVLCLPPDEEDRG